MKRLFNTDKPTSAGQLQREERELHRLETLVDVVFALVLVMVTVDLPLPEDSATLDIGSFVVQRVEALVTAALAIIVILVYWFQSNLLLGNLARTDGKHAAFSIFQVFFLLLYLLAVSLGISVGQEPLVLAMQSVTAALVGFAAASAWWYASHNRRLLTPEVDDSEVTALRLRVLAEPITAMLTLAFAFVSAFAWEICWLAYPLIAAILRKLGVGARSAGESRG